MMTTMKVAHTPIGVPNTPVSSANRSVDGEPGGGDSFLGFLHIKPGGAHLDSVKPGGLGGLEFFLEGFPFLNHAEFQGFLDSAFQGETRLRMPNLREERCAKGGTS